MSDHPDFSHPDCGDKIDVEQIGRKVVITLHTNGPATAADIARNIVAGLASGELRLTLAGTPSHIQDSEHEQ